jgi:UDP-N-acetylmuramate dehydrogenase
MMATASTPIRPDRPTAVGPRPPYRNAPIGPMTWFRVGGPAEVLFRPADAEDLADFLKALPAEVPVTVIGVGSNLLVRDGGIPASRSGLGAVSSMIRSRRMRGSRRCRRARPQCGADRGRGRHRRARIPVRCARHDRRRASDECRRLWRRDQGCAGRGRRVDRSGTIHRVPGRANWAFRIGIPMRRRLDLHRRAAARPARRSEREIARRMAEIKAAREASQPIRARTGGSTFANPPGDQAWRLIDAAGCRGLVRGGAMVSEKHTNFLINTGNASAADIEGLGEEVRRRVHAQFGIVLEWEIRRVGRPVHRPSGKPRTSLPRRPNDRIALPRKRAPPRRRTAGAPSSSVRAICAGSRCGARRWRSPPGLARGRHAERQPLGQACSTSPQPGCWRCLADRRARPGRRAISRSRVARPPTRRRSSPRSTPMPAPRSSRSARRAPRSSWRRCPGCARRRSSDACRVRCYVRLVERHPLAVWQHDGKQELIDRDGTVIPVTDLSRFAKLPTVVGDDQARHGAALLLDLLASEPELAARVTAACWSATGAGTCASTMRSTCCCRRTTWPAPGPSWRSSNAPIGAAARRPDGRSAAARSAGDARHRHGAAERRAGQKAAFAGEEHMSLGDDLDGGRTGRRQRNGAGNGRASTPVRPRGSLIAGVDIGSTKICCFIARVDGAEPRILGIGHQVSRGMKSGAIVNLDEVSDSIRSAVHAAEEMADETIERAVVSLSAGFGPSRMVKAEIGIGGREISDGDMRHVLERGYQMRDSGDRAVIHSFPVGFSIDDSRGIRDPRGMIGDAARRQHAHRDRRPRRGAQPQRRDRPRHARSRCAGRQPLRGRPVLPGRGRDATSASPSSTWAAARRRSGVLSAAIWSSPTSVPVGGGTSPTTSPAACRPRSPMPSG